MAVRSTSNTLKMQFGLENGNISTLSLKDPKDNLTMTEVTDVGESMVAKEALIVGGSPIAFMKDAYTETITRNDLA